jgi:hypothetical protein
MVFAWQKRSSSARKHVARPTYKYVSDVPAGVILVKAMGGLVIEKIDVRCFQRPQLSPKSLEHRLERD